jgi:hypothetical protein
MSWSPQRFLSKDFYAFSPTLSLGPSLVIGFHLITLTIVVAEYKHLHITVYNGTCYCPFSSSQQGSAVHGHHPVSLIC